MSSFDTSTQTQSTRALTHQSYSFPPENDTPGQLLLRKAELSKNLSIHMTDAGPVIEGHGTPSYPSPLDRIRTGRRERAAQFGLRTDLQESFEGNQSFPKAKKSLLSDGTKPAVKVKLSDFKGRGLNDVSFSAGHSRGSFVSQSDGDALLSDSWSFYNYLGHSSSRVTFPTTVRNPNKAICMVNAQTSQILIVNEMACELFGYKEEELVTRRLCDLIKLKSKQQTSIPESHVEETTGTIIEVSGKVVDAIDYTGLCVPISLWVKCLPNEDEPRCLVVMEPVERTVAKVQFNSRGTITSCDVAMRQLYGYSHSDPLAGLHINQLIPSLKLPTSATHIPKEISKQRATGRSRAGGTFPLSIALQLSDQQRESNDADCIYDAVVWVFANISGLITFLHDGTIHSINENFSLTMFGYTPEELIGKDISVLIPDFYSIIEDDSDSFMSLAKRAPLETEARDTSGQMSVDTSFGASWEEPSLATVSASSECSASTSSRTAPAGEQHKNEKVRPASPGDAARVRANPKLRTVLKQSAHSSIDYVGPVGTVGPVTSTPDIKLGSKSSQTQLTESVERSNDLVNADISERSGNFGPSGIPSEAAGIASTFSTYKPINRLVESRAKYSTIESTPINGKTTKLSASQSFNALRGDCGVNVEIEVERLFIHRNDKNTEFFNNADVTGGDNNVRNGTKVCRPDVLESSSDFSRCTESPVKLSDGSLHGNEVCRDHSAGNLNASASGGRTSPKLSGHSPKHRRKLTRTPHQNWRSATERGQLSPNDRRALSRTPSPTCSGDVPREDSMQRRKKLTKSPNFLTVDSPSDYYESSDAPYMTSGRSFCVNVTPPPERCEPWSYRQRKSSNRSESTGDLKRLTTDFKAQKTNDETGSSFDGSKSASQTELFHKMMSRHALFAQTGRSKAVCTSADGEYSPESKSKSPSPTPSVISSRDLKNMDLIRKALRGKVISSGNRYSSDRSIDASRYSSSDKSVDVSVDETSKSPMVNLTHQTSLTGNFCGDCRHKDGSHLGVVFQIKRVTMEDGSVIFCIWMSRDPEEAAEGGRSLANLTLASSLSTLSTEARITDGIQLYPPVCFQPIDASIQKSPSKDLASSSKDNAAPNKDGASTSKEDIVSDLHEGRGLYNEKYHTLRCIGKGAYGFVRLARRISDKQQVVVKFIRRNKIHPERWNHDPVYGYCPVEISLLSQLDHPNIVKIVDVFHNDDFYQLVMEKHGSGMDMFEFIDRAPNLDEPLGSYLFRQIVWAASYLHNNGILHRDIKDENVILDENFRIKLIDFGAATFTSPGKLFATFCGTLEYCSPEVLLGNKYRGPELEVWSLGVTLYTLVFGENPFYDHNETIECILKPPFPVSNSLMFLLTWMLHRDPATRMTLQRIEENSWVTQPVDISMYNWHEVLPNSEFYGNTASDNRSEHIDNMQYYDICAQHHPDALSPCQSNSRLHQSNSDTFAKYRDVVNDLDRDFSHCLNIRTNDTGLQEREFYDSAIVR